jgi:hypothetical protein
MQGYAKQRSYIFVYTWTSINGCGLSVFRDVVVERISVVTCDAPEDIDPQLPRANLPAVGCPNQGDFDACLGPIRVFAEHRRKRARHAE